MSCAACIVSVWLSWMLSLVFLYVFNFSLLVFMSCVNYIIEKRKRKGICALKFFFWRTVLVEYWWTNACVCVYRNVGRFGLLRSPTSINNVCSIFQKCYTFKRRTVHYWKLVRNILKVLCTTSHLWKYITIFSSFLNNQKYVSKPLMNS